MTSTPEPKKKSRRINFLQSTKLELAKRAGFLCSFPGCLIHTTGPTANDDGEDSAAGIAVAAHIYPASEKGPRQQKGLTPDQIRHISNGIWLCGKHGILIDQFQDDYPPETVIEMKQVREFAQSLTIHLEDVSYFAGWIGPKRFDAIVWKHWPNPDQELLRRDIVSVGLKCIPKYDETFGPQMPLPPASFELKPLSKAAGSIPPPVDVASVIVRPARYPADRRRAVRIVSSWFEAMKQVGWDGRGPYFDDVYVKITARNPDTGAIAEQFVWVKGDCVGEYDYNVIDGETVTLTIDNTVHNASNFDWRLIVNLKDGECRTESTLHMGRPISPRNSGEVHERAEVQAYAELLNKLASGWEPIGFVGLKPGDWCKPEHIHPEAFAIRCAIPQAQLDQAIQRSAKARLGYELADAWECCFCFTDMFFSDALDEASIRKVSDDLLTKHGSELPLYIRSEQIVALNYRFGIRLTLKHGNLFFREALTESLRQSRW